MENTLSRRDFLSRTVNTKEPTNEKPEGEDPYFKKYANREIPFSSHRTSTGLAPYTGPWTKAEVMHLLRRSTFGLTQQNVYILNTFSGAAEAVNFLLYVTQYPTTTPVNIYEAEYHDTEGCPFGESWVNFAAPDNGDSLLSFYRTEYTFKPWWISQMVNQKPDLLEKMTLFWSNHFGCRTSEFNQPKAIWQHYQTIRSYALGNVKNLVKSMTVDPHMLNVLNGQLSSARAPDENYARELQELFTVGKGPNSKYTEDDVKQAAKILTGWRRTVNADGSYSTWFNAAEHDSSDKQFSAFYGNKLINGQGGDNGRYETDALTDMIFETDECAKYICRCIYRWFVYYVIGDEEEQNIITPLATILRNNNYEVGPVLQALFNSEHFFDALNRGCIIKSPLDLYVGFNREIGVNIPSTPIDLNYLFYRHFKIRCDNVGQKIADPVDISGWPAYRQEPVFYEAWINSTTIQTRAESLNLYCSTGFQLIPYHLTYVKADSVAFNKGFSNPGDPDAVIASFAEFLLPLPVSSKQLAVMKTYLMLNLTDDTYWTRAWNAYVADPGNAMADQLVRQRLDNLLEYITNLEEYQLY